MAASMNNATDVFYIKYHFKKIGQIQYYVCTISEYIDDQYESSNVMKLNDYNITIAMSTEKEATPYLTPDVIPSAVLPKSLAFNRKFHMNTVNSFSTTANLNSVSDNASSLLGTSSTNLMGKIKMNKTSKKNLIIKQDPDIPVIIPRDDIKKNKATMDRLNKGTAKLIYFKLFESFCLFAIFMLNIGTFIYNQTSLNVSINLFNINAYSFLLANDIFYGSMATLNLCLLKDGIQTGDVDNLHKKIQQRCVDFIRFRTSGGSNRSTNKIIIISAREVAKFGVFNHDDFNKQTSTQASKKTGKGKRQKGKRQKKTAKEKGK